MLEFTIDKFWTNLFYQSQNVIYVDLLGNEYQILDVDRYGVNYEATLLNINSDLSVKILGGHELLFVDMEMETVNDL